VGNDTDVRCFGKSRYLTCARDPTDQAYVWTNELNSLTVDEHLELPKCGHPLSGSNRDSHLARHIGHFIEVVCVTGSSRNSG
jgi:hypothetical protein